jgi:hypothetical protein
MIAKLLRGFEDGSSLYPSFVSLSAASRSVIPMYESGLFESNVI